MKQRSSHNWKTKSGGWDSLNTTLINFSENYPILSSIFIIADYQVVICNNYKGIHENSLVSMFVDDYILERFWNNPTKYIRFFEKSKCVMSPDFSIYVDMPKPMQMWNVYRNRLVGYVWQCAGINVIPTISWGDVNTFDFCFEGIEIGSVVAVSNIGCRNDEHKKYFDSGFVEMQKRIKPKQIVFLCNKKYKKYYQQENIIFIDSFWDLKRKQNKI